MSAPSSIDLQHRHWSRDGFMISTDSSLIPVAEVNAAFASEDLHWAKPLPEDVMLATLRNSLCFGLYCIEGDSNTTTTQSTDKPPLKLIGLARCITDFTTFLYLTDVYVLPPYKAQGLVKWLVSCVQEVIVSMPYLRRSLLFTGDWKRSVPFYERNMDMEVHEGRRPENGKDGVGLAILTRKGPGYPR